MIRKMKTFWNSLDETTIVSKRELFLEIVAVALTGLVLGMIFTPKKTVTIGSNNSGNGCNCGNSGCDGCEDCGDEDEEA
ncbi:MAG: hypothetical protein MSA09_08695 [Lachnospiraceae bacterium]|nr:hypothetical protein [Lachnospiraceae bacterium]